MLRNRLTLVLALLLALVSTTGHAFWDPPYITPANPATSDEVSVSVRLGICDSFYQRAGYPKITRDGNTIRIVNFGQHWDPGDLCSFGIGTATYSIGAFVPGDYTLTVDLFYLDFFSQSQTLTLGVVAFTVTGAAPPAIPAPTTSPLGLLALILALSTLTAWVLRAHRTG